MDITVRHAEPEDARALRDLFSTRAVLEGTLGLPYPDLRFWQERIDAMGPSRGSFGLVAEADGRLVGLGSLHADNASPRRRHAAEVGLVVHPGWHGKGVGRALLDALIDLGENWLGLRRLELTVYADNDAAIRLYESCGFRREGLHRDYAFRAGRFVDALCMARLTT